MLKSFALPLLFSFLLILPLRAQKPEKPDAAVIYQQIKRLNFLGSVLYVAAHPDDENTRLISYLSNELHARTGYLSLTRGDGGQNLIGPELRELLGVIRTQELIEARKIDGGEQFFTRANDFGFSKNPVETLRIWDKDSVLGDLVSIVRQFKPDIIINRFDARSPGTTHGHHTASAMLSLEGFEMAAKPEKYSAQLKYTTTWQPKRIFFNTSWWFYGSKEKFEKADKSMLTEIKMGVYYPLLGHSNQEIAALSRSCHKSQGFGSTGTRGEESEFLEFLKGDAAAEKSNLFSGIDTSWNRVRNGAAIGKLLQEVEDQYDFKNPSASIPGLVKAYQLIQQLEDVHWRTIKSEEIKKIIAACAGLYLEAVASVSEANPGSTLKVKIEAINRSSIPMVLKQLSGPGLKSENFSALPLENNQGRKLDLDYQVGEAAKFTQPYWLEKAGTTGMYRVDNPRLVGKPDIIRDHKLTFVISVSGVDMPFDRNLIYKMNDDVKGEVYTPFDIVPIVSTSIEEKVLLFRDNQSKTVQVKVKAGADKVRGTLQLTLPSGWSAKPTSAAFSLISKGEEQTLSFQISAPKNETEGVLKFTAMVDGVKYTQEQCMIKYDHISRQQVLKNSEAKLIKLDLKKGKERIAYIMGAGDEVPKSLKEMGYEVSVLDPKSITAEKLQNFDTVITGIRAYNTIQDLAFVQPLLFEFVKAGHNMIVQYNTLDDLVTPNLAPYPLKISRDRVTDENAVVSFPDPGHPVLHTPNQISTKDFEGWMQEQGLYYPNEWDAAFSPILSSADEGEQQKKGALLIAKYGKGNYIYTGLSFFRELPEGVTGAYRLMANMISLPKNP